MTTRFVRNQATMSCCGRHRGRCTCGGLRGRPVAMNQAQYEEDNDVLATSSEEAAACFVANNASDLLTNDDVRREFGRQHWVANYEETGDEPLVSPSMASLYRLEEKARRNRERLENRPAVENVRQDRHDDDDGILGLPGDYLH